MQKHIHIIQNGTVIDHLKNGLGSTIAQLISSDQDVVTIGINLESKTMGKKDILKFSNRVLTDQEISLVSVLSGMVTINAIQNGKVISKIQTTMPEMFTGYIDCPNPRCITNHEAATTKFKTQPLRCYYCERALKFGDIRVKSRKI